MILTAPMKNFALSLFALAFYSAVFAQAPLLQRQVCTTGSQEGFADVITKVHMRTSDGNIITGGTTNFSFSWFIGKLDKNLNWIWQRSHTTPDTSYVMSIQPGIDGGFIMASANHCRISCSSYGMYGNGWDGMLQRFSNNGDTVWQKALGGTGADFINYATKADDSGYVYIGKSSSTNGQLASAFIAGQAVRGRIWLGKVAANGIPLWNRTFGGNSTLDHGVIVKPTPDGGLIAGANIYSTTLNGVGNHGSCDIWIAKLNRNGVVEWQRNYGGSNEDKLADIEIATDGYVFAGTTKSWDGDALRPFRDSINVSGWVVNINSQGNIRWHKGLKIGSEMHIKDIARTAHNGWVMTGHTFGLSHHPNPALGRQVFVTELDQAGNTLSNTILGGTGDDQGSNIFPENDKQYIISGTVKSNEREITCGNVDGAIWTARLGASNTIKGTIYFDANSNGVKDAGERWASGVRVNSTGSSTVSTVSNAVGFFDLLVDTGAYHTTVLPPSNFTVSPSAHVSFFAGYNNNDSISFALQPIPNKQDLVINAIALGAARSGFTTDYQVLYKNVGTTTIPSGQILFKKDNRLTYLSSSRTVNATAGDTLKWNYSNLAPGDTGAIWLRFRLLQPPAVNNGDTLRFVAIITPVAGDLTPQDDTAILRHRVTGSFDPNDKLENNAGVIQPEHITDGKYLNYTIRFQNTGTDTAFTVVVRDTLDMKVDPATFEMVSGSHNYDLSINNNRQLVWTFNEINLPDSNINEPLSHGRIVYRIKPVNTVAVGDTIHNTASIYFDYNLPVVTNNAFTTVKSQPIVLPLHTLSFTGARTPAGSKLQWTTQGEYNMDRFEVERSFNGIAFQQIAKATPKGNRQSIAKYDFTDAEANGNERYVWYRLKLLNKDASFTYSKTIRLHLTKSDALSLYPNPAQSVVYLQVAEPVYGNIVAIITDAKGTAVYKQVINQPAGGTRLTVPLPSLSAGNYTISLQAGAKQYVQKMIIQ